MQNKKAYELATTGWPKHRHSLRDGVNGLLRAHPGETGLFCHRPLADHHPQDLAPATGAPGLHTFAVRACFARHANRARPSHSIPRFVAIASRPSMGWNGRIIDLIWGSKSRKISEIRHIISLIQTQASP
jgi:hypothetical protein